MTIHSYKMKTRISIIFVTIYIQAVCCSTNGNGSDWDILLFTQHWPVTVCLQWKELYEQHTCLFPKFKNTWTVHGIWPSRFGSEGPQFCNSSLHFNVTELAPIEQQLEQHWVNIYNGTSLQSLWKHEWKKHGTCAASLPSLSTEIKYFSQGLNWLSQYNMTKVLSNGNITLDSKEGFTADEIYTSIQQVLGVDADIQCIYYEKIPYLFEVRLCFNKNLTVINCDGIKPSIQNGSTITNCPLNKKILYVSNLPTTEMLPKHTFVGDTSVSYPHWSLTLLRVVKFLQWLTF